MNNQISDINALEKVNFEELTELNLGFNKIFIFKFQQKSILSNYKY